MQRFANFFASQVNHARFAPWLSKVKFFSIDNDDSASSCFTCSVGDELFRKRHYLGVITKCLVALHHRELWVVTRGDAFVAKHAADLKYALHAANDQALEVQLECDAQKELHVERVVMGDEWASVSTADFHVQHRGFYFDELIVVQRLSKAGNRCMTYFKCSTSLFVDDQVGIALAITSVDIGESMPFVWHRTHRLSQQLRFVDFD